jgi:signal transduction histidine kinase
MALYTVRDLAEKIAKRAPDEQFHAGVQQFVRAVTTTSQEREQAVSLQEYLGAVLPAATSPAVTDVPWVVFGPKEKRWLVSASGGGQSAPSVIVAVRLATFTSNMAAIPLLRDNGIRLVFSGEVPDAEPVGGMLAALALTLQPSQPDALTSEEMLQRRFYIAALLLVIGITWAGGYLFWQHVRRDLHVAEMRSQFVSSVSHELKTPLTSIRMFAETLLLGRTSRAETRHEYLETIVNETERLTRLINNVLEFSKIEQGTKTYRLAPQSVAEIIEGAAKVMEYPLAQEGFELRRNLEPSVPSLPVDRDAIQQAVLNLLSNAMKYSGDSRTIELALSSTPREVHISVSDRGCGIPESEQGRVFQKFYRSASAERQHIPGTGLGLTIVEHVAAAHGGRVSVASQVGHGSTFSIVLPIPRTDGGTQISERPLDSAHASHPGH